MKKIFFCILLTKIISITAIAQGSWTVCNTPAFTSRVDDVFMVNIQTGYAVCGDGKIVKTIDGGDSWQLLLQDSTVYCRSVEFINTQKGFVGSFSNATSPNNILRKTLDGGSTWTDLTPLLNPKARKGICGLAVADSNTIYGCGNWFQDSAYIEKSVDGGITWSFIDMSGYATSLIDMYFTGKDTGFVTGRGLAPLKTAVILYTTDGGITWTYKFQNTVAQEYCWKIQHLKNQLYWASIEDFTTSSAKILKSTDGGMNWNVIVVNPLFDNIEGTGFIDSLKGWCGGGFYTSYETNDGGVTWDSISICPSMNRVFKVNDSLLFASGNTIWKYDRFATGIHTIQLAQTKFATISCSPNPVSDQLTINITLKRSTHALVFLMDAKGTDIQQIDNTGKPAGEYKYRFNTQTLHNGIYYVVLKTHEDKQVAKIIVNH